MQSFVSGVQIFASGMPLVFCLFPWYHGNVEGAADRAVEVSTMEGKEGRIMKIAVTYEDGNVFPHFGHTAQFKVYETGDGKVLSARVEDTNGSGHGALAGLLSAWKVDTLICGGIGAGAQAALAEAGIQLYGGMSGSADEAVEALLAGKLAFDPEVHCDHHVQGHHGEGHSCGEEAHGCAGDAGRCHK